MLALDIDSIAARIATKQPILFSVTSDTLATKTPAWMSTRQTMRGTFSGAAEPRDVSMMAIRGVVSTLLSCVKPTELNRSEAYSRTRGRSE